MDAWVAWAASLSVAAPLLGAFVCFMKGGGPAAAVAITVPAVTLAAAAVMAVGVGTQGAMQVPVGAWEAPLGIVWRIDGLAILFLGTVSGVAAGVALYAHPELHHEGGKAMTDHFWPQMLLLLASLNALALSNDIFNLYVTLELMTLGAVAMVALAGEGVALVAALRYLLVAMFGSLSYLLGVGLLYGAFGTLDIDLLARAMRPGVTASAALALMTAGLLAKGAFFPLHGWLPPAHGSAPAPASALLSSLVVKGAFYILLRLWLEVFQTGGPGAAAPQVIGVLGTGAVVWGSVLALRQIRLKLLLAYSTVAQLGYLLLGVPLALGGAGSAVGGIVQLMMAHAFAKASMFLAAGTLILSLGHDRLADLGGTARHRPLTAFTLALGGLTLMGLPPSGGFIAKWLLLEASLRGGQWWWAFVVLAGSLLAAGYVFRVLMRTIARRRPEAPPFRRVPRRMEYTAFALALVSIALGLSAVGPLTLLSDGGTPERGP